MVSFVYGSVRSPGSQRCGMALKECSRNSPSSRRSTVQDDLQYTRETHGPFIVDFHGQRRPSNGSRRCRTPGCSLRARSVPICPGNRSHARETFDFAMIGAGPVSTPPPLSRHRATSDDSHWPRDVRPPRELAPRDPRNVARIRDLLRTTAAPVPDRHPSGQTRSSGCLRQFQGTRHPLRDRPLALRLQYFLADQGSQ